MSFSNSFIHYLKKTSILPLIFNINQPTFFRFNLFIFELELIIWMTLFDSFLHFVKVHKSQMLLPVNIYIKYFYYNIELIYETNYFPFGLILINNFN